jgi:DNA primase
MTSWKSRKSVGRWGRRIAAGCLWFALCDSIVLGFGKWAPFNIRNVNIERRTGSLSDASENFLTELDLSARNVSRAVFQSAPTSSSPNFVSPEKLQKLQDSVNVVSVIESFGLPQFKKSGEFRASCLCPFHDDHNPSMSIDGAKGIYKCFSCGAGGNVFTFVREYAKLQGEELSFYNAVKLVNDRFAVGNEAFALNLPPGTKETLQDSSTGKKFPKKNFPVLSQSAISMGTKAFDTNKKRIILVNAAAVAFYENCLVTRPSAGLARTHLRVRGMSPRTVRAFAIGYAPDSFFSESRKNGPQSWGEGSLVQHLQQKGFTTTEIVDAGLATVVKKQREETPETADVPFSSLIDRFRGRLVVPIFDESGLQVLGFGGRILESPSNDASPGNYTQPKYLNSPETPVFQKKNILFGQHMARKALRFWDKEEGIPRAVVIVEGYMDAIALWQAGVREAVASMGTALTTEQISSAAILAGSKNGKSCGIYWILEKITMRVD